MIFLFEHDTFWASHGILATLQCKHRYHDFLHVLLLRSSASERPLHHGVEQWSPLWVVPCKACLCARTIRTMKNHDGISWHHSSSSVFKCFVAWHHAIPPRPIAKSRGFICQMLRGQKQRNQGSTQQICGQLAQMVGGIFSRLDSAERVSLMGIYNIFFMCKTSLRLF